MRAREPKLHAISLTKLFEIIVSILGAVVTLKLFYFSFKLSCNEIIEVVEGGKDMCFIGNGKSPKEIGTIIKK